MLKWRRRPAWCRLGAAREGGLNPWMRWYSTEEWFFDVLKNEFLEVSKFLAAGFQPPKRFDYRAQDPTGSYRMSTWGSFTFTSWKWDIDSVRTPPISDMKSSPRSIPRSDKLPCNINIFLAVSETATPWHGVSISNCTQQETPGVLSRNWLAITFSKTHSNAAVQIFQSISEFPDKLYWTYGISWASRHMCIACLWAEHRSKLSFKLPNWLHEHQGCWVCSCVPTGKKRSKSSAWTETSRSPFSKKRDEIEQQSFTKWWCENVSAHSSTNVKFNSQFQRGQMTITYKNEGAWEHWRSTGYTSEWLAQGTSVL